MKKWLNDKWHIDFTSVFKNGKWSRLILQALILQVLNENRLDPDPGLACAHFNLLIHSLPALSTLERVRGSLIKRVFERATEQERERWAVL